MSKPRKRTAHKRTRRVSDAIKILDAMVGKDPRARQRADQAVEEAIIGHVIYNARVDAGLTQKQLAKLVRTDQSVISRIEDANYEGHSLSLLRRIAAALGKRIQIRFLDAA